jgi:selenocysteine-specific elongation factor
MTQETAPLVLGTAGHIDHGKTALVRALSGIDCDRLPEEKERGITIELGFAPLDLPSGRRMGVVDVPGHERLVRTMVAGAAGIDLVLFVVAADEGVMPQTREHLAICELLGIERGVVALTKIDAVDAELAELARLEVEEELSGTSLAGAAVVGVSALSGAGIPELLAELDRLAAEARTRTVRDGPAWLPVDRSFTMRGFGTVVTGTLRGAAFEEGKAVEVFPDGARDTLNARLRGLQVHGEAVPRAIAGSRCAANLQGIEVSAVPRGSVVADPGRLDYRPRIEVELRLLAGAPALASGASLTVHVGTSERVARLRLLDSDRLEPGARGFAEFRFDVPIVAVEGDRFIVRGFSRIPDAGWTLGGGRLLDVAPHRRRRRTERVEDLAAIAAGAAAEAIAVRLRRAGIAGVSAAELRRDVRSLDEIHGVRVGADRWLDPTGFEELVARALEAIDAHHRETPEDPWVGLASVARRLPRRASEEAIRAALEAAVARGDLESASSGVRRVGHAAHAADPELAERLLESILGAGLAPPLLDALAREHGWELKAAQAAAEHLVRQDSFVRVATGLFFGRRAIEELRQRLVAYLREHESIDPAAYKELTGQTRKYTVPLMEFFDAEKVTTRSGNVRILRGG